MDEWKHGVLSRSIHLIGLGALTLIAFGALTDERRDLNFIDPAVWFTLYCMAASAVVVFVAFGTRLSLQMMTLMVMGIGLLRGTLYVIQGGGTTYLGMNILIALYATFAHRYERERVVSEQ